MKLTIVVEDNAVTKDGRWVADLDLSGAGIPADVTALQWDNDSGWIEKQGDTQNEDISSLPSWATSCQTVLETALNALDNPTVTDEQKTATNEANAKALLASSDWTQLPDCGLTDACVASFVTYRASLRGIAISPTADATFPTKPTNEWA
jgi:hypothetical protein